MSSQQDYANIKAISNRTVEQHGRKMEANSCRNIPSLAKSYGIKDLRNKFKGMPCVVAGAGPSLNASIPLLKERQGSYVLICVDRALKPLLAAGIVPHIVCASDMDKILVNLFSGYRIPESVALLYDRDCYWEVPKAWMGPRISYDSFFDTGIWQATFVGRKGFLCKNFTVSHTAFYVAAALGCSPVILTGVDLAYPTREEHHVDGAVQFAEEADTLHRSHWTTMPGNAGGVVDTTEVFSVCVPAFAAAIAETKALVVNTSTVGCALPGAKFIGMEAILDQVGLIDDYQGRFDAIYASTPHSFNLEEFDRQTKHVIKALIKIEINNRTWSGKSKVSFTTFLPTFYRDTSLSSKLRLVFGEDI